MRVHVHRSREHESSKSERRARLEAFNRDEAGTPHHIHAHTIHTRPDTRRETETTTQRRAGVPSFLPKHHPCDSTRRKSRGQRARCQHITQLHFGVFSSPALGASAEEACGVGIRRGPLSGLDGQCALVFGGCLTTPPFLTHPKSLGLYVARQLTNETLGAPDAHQTPLLPAS